MLGPIHKVVKPPTTYNPINPINPLYKELPQVNKESLGLE